MGEIVVFLDIFDTCDVMYNWSISLLPPIVLDNLFDEDHCVIIIIFPKTTESADIKLDLLNYW